MNYGHLSITPTINGGYALDVETREIVGCYIGDHSGASAQKLWDSLPPVYRQCAVCYSCGHLC